jgi:anti-anti-sigma regulatory factor
MVEHMPMTAVLLKVDPERVADCLQELHAKLGSAKGETVLDFSSVQRVDAKAIRAMEELAGLADAKGVKIGLCGVNVEIYKVLKLVSLAPRFSFVA